nr:MAG: hypothetical protein [Trichoderma harzianum mononegavirus 2]
MTGLNPSDKLKATIQSLIESSTDFMKEEHNNCSSIILDTDKKCAGCLRSLSGLGQCPNCLEIIRIVTSFRLALYETLKSQWIGTPQSREECRAMILSFAICPGLMSDLDHASIDHIPSLIRVISDISSLPLAGFPE